MLYKTRGIVFRFTKYGETSIIVNIFTELFGLQGYIINSVRTKSSKNKIALFQPLTLLDLIVYHRPNANLNRIKEVKCIHPFQSLTVDIKKSAVSMFINEIVNKTVKDESHAKEVFEFLFRSLVMLDTAKQNTENFHLIFLLKLSRYLGFGAHHLNEVLGGRMADIEIEHLLNKLINIEYEDEFVISNSQRKILLELILKFYHDHIDSLGDVKSMQVLQEVLS